MITFVLFNGPAQSGKSTLALAAQTLLRQKYPTRVTKDEFKAPIIAALVGLVESHFPQFQDYSYDELKRAEFGDGVTGRDIMIDIGNALRFRDPHFLPRIVASNIENIMYENPIVFVDDLGFEPEYQYLCGLPNSKTIVVYTESRHHRIYGHGEQFEGDSRICLRGHADFIDPEPDVLAESISALIEQLGE